MPQREDKIISMIMPLELLELIDNRAKSLYLSRSDYIRQVMLAACRGQIKTPAEMRLDKEVEVDNWLAELREKNG